MNDILAPIYVVFLADNLSESVLKLENNFELLKEQITDDLMLKVETDSYFCY